jgi:hypothetical protein
MQIEDGALAVSLFQVIPGPADALANTVTRLPELSATQMIALDFLESLLIYYLVIEAMLCPGRLWYIERPVGGVHQ